jgi:ABC-2 type transport system ATP-binding protein
LFGRLKGLYRYKLNTLVEFYLNEFNLIGDADKAVEYVSAGKRRLLNVAVTLIGAPLVAFFDEPTIGLDPIAKRSVWRLLT